MLAKRIAVWPGLCSGPAHTHTAHNLPSTLPTPQNLSITHQPYLQLHLSDRPQEDLIWTISVYNLHAIVVYQVNSQSKESLSLIPRQNRNKWEVTSYPCFCHQAVPRHWVRVRRWDMNSELVTLPYTFSIIVKREKNHMRVLRMFTNLSLKCFLCHHTLLLSPVISISKYCEYSIHKTQIYICPKVWDFYKLYKFHRRWNEALRQHKA